MSEYSRIERGFINLRGNGANEHFASAVESALGVKLIRKPNTTSAGDRHKNHLYWLGPDEWLVGTARENSGHLVGQLEAATAGMSVAVNDISGGMVLTTLSAAIGREVLERGCTLDLHPEKFAAGDCAQTSLAKANIVLACIDDAPVYEIIVRRSFSEYLLRWLRQTHHSLAGSASSS
ncbi:MAG: sarcosine oxidase subunit gamma [Woeseiaceae bacterium]|nr:sarcosine oxidase subunit gamma [Woeseiaceae bacterium]